MEWLIITLLALILVILVVYSLLSLSGIAGVAKGQQELTKNMQAISDQMADMEEQFAETKGDVRKNTQYFVNFAKSMRQPGNKRWEDGM